MSCDKTTLADRVNEDKKMEKGKDTETMSVASTQKSNQSARSGYASSVNSEFINEKCGSQVSKIQSKMKVFVKGMIKGREMSVLSVDGQLRACTCSFDRKLRNFAIEINRQTRKVPLASIQDVQQGTEPDDIDTPLDELCSTLILDTGECISFRFNDVPTREDFAMCLQIILDGQR